MLSLLVGLTEHRPKQLDNLRLAFDYVDRDHDGRISATELIDACKELGNPGFQYKWPQVVMKCDLDGDGALDYQDFIGAAIDHSKFVTRDNIEKVFKLFDRNNSGKIDIEEFMIALPKCYDIDTTELFKNQPAG